MSRWRYPGALRAVALMVGLGILLLSNGWGRFVAGSEEGEYAKASDSWLSLGEIQFEGQITLLPQSDSLLGIWGVDDVRLSVEAATKVVGTPRLGDFVEVRAIQEGQTVARAQEIWVVDPADRVALQGRIRRWPVSAAGARGEFALQTFGGLASEMTIMFDERTFLDESGGRIESGALVEVRAVQLPDGRLRAKYVRVRRP